MEHLPQTIQKSKFYAADEPALRNLTMLDLKQIESFYPRQLRSFKRNLLREYLQFKILEIIFDSPLGAKLCFMGGTAIHILHENDRFSEDLDFDNLGLNQTDFTHLASLVKKRLGQEGYQIEVRSVFQKAFRSYLQFRTLLFQYGLSRHEEEKLLIQVDAEPQRFSYRPEQTILSKFDVFLRINAVPIDLLLAQKIFCLFNRPRPIGRDFYDVIFLLGKTKPNLDYLRERLQVEDAAALKAAILKKCKQIDFRQLARDVEPFLFQPAHHTKILSFQELIERTDLKE
jgi:predicted nucleotidyltransferase component of viral defense system